MYVKNPSKFDSELHLKQTALRLYSDADFICKALLALYERQTDFEVVIRATKLKNEKGFNRPDAPMLSAAATAILNGEKPSEKVLLQVIGPRLAKYARQLSEIFPS